MTPLRLARRRAERFADLVDGLARDDAGVDRSTVELLELVGALRAAPEVAPRPEFVSDLRAQLMAAAETELAPAEDSTPRERLAARRVDDRLTVAPRRRPRERRLALAAGALALVGATTSVAVASQSALPGQALYPLKRGIEDTHASLAIGDRSKGSVVLANASDRLSEARDLSREDDGAANADTAARVTQTLQDFNDQVKQGSDLLISDYNEHHDAASINQLRDFDATSVLTLSELDGIVPADSQSALVGAAKQLFLIDAAAGSLCPDCTSTGITEIPPTLLASGTLDGSALQSGTDGLGSGPSAGPSGGPQTVPTDTVSIPPSLLPTGLPTVGPSASAAASSAAAQPTSAASTGVLGGILGGVLGGGKGGKSSDKPTPTLPVNPSQVVSSATAAVSAVASAVGSAVGGVVSTAASDVGGLVGGTVGGLTGNQNK